MSRREPPIHGITSNGYCNYGCRCDLCRAVWAAYVSQRKAQRVGTQTADMHGKASTYGNYGCRCDLCRSAYSADCSARRLRRIARRGDS